jgi:DNA repair exonuclease SbcCD ATPase subunit
VKLLGFGIKNYRKIKAFEMTLGDNGLYKIKGPNGQGKTSAIKAVEFLLAGRRGSVHEGEKSAEVVGHIKDNDQEWTIVRELTADNKMSLKVSGSVSGKRDKAPQAFLDGLINELTFDPRPFVNKTAAERVKMYTEVMGLDFSVENKKIASLYEVRRSVGRKIKDIGNPEVPFELLSVEMPDINALVNQRKEKLAKFQDDLAKVHAFNREQDEKQNKIDKLSSAKDNLCIQRDDVAGRIYKIQKELEDLQKEKESLEERIDKGVKMIAACEEPQPVKAVPCIDTAEIDEKIAAAESLRDKISERKSHEDKIAKKAELQKEYDDLDEEISALRRAKIEKASWVQAPVKGLELRIGDDGEELYYNDRPSDDWAESEALRISAELCAAKRPDLRCIFIDGGESYDKKALESLHNWAVENDIQAIITIVDDISEDIEHDDNTFWIEDGELHAI